MIKNCDETKNRGRGLFKAGILLLLAAAAITGFAAWRGLGTLRWGMSECLQWQATSLSDRFIIVDQEHQKLNAMVFEFAQKIEAGIISPLRGFEVLRAFYKGPVMLALVHASIINHIQSLAVPDGTDLPGIDRTCRQFFAGVQSGKIAPTDWESIQSVLIAKQICETASSIGFIVPEQIETFKKNIGLHTLLDCLAKMDQANRQTAISEEAATLDPVEELQKILAATAAGGQ